MVAGSVVTGDGHSVEGRDPASGNAQWSYSRDLDLCGVSWVYQYAVAVYPDTRGCGQVSTIDAKTGERGPSRTAYADPEVTLSSDGTTVLSAGDSRLELWRSDMVRMLSYGSLDARIKPGTPASPLCRLVSAAASSAAVSVLESCPNHPDLRLTLLRPADDEDTPEVKYVPQPGVSGESDARVVAVSDTTTAVYVPTPKPTVNIIDETGATIASTPLSKPVSKDATMSRAGDLITWWTGDSVMVFSANGLKYKYTVTPAGANVPAGTRDGHGRTAARPGHRRIRRVRRRQRSGRPPHPGATTAEHGSGCARGGGSDGPRAAGRRTRSVGLIAICVRSRALSAPQRTQIAKGRACTSPASGRSSSA